VKHLRVAILLSGLITLLMLSLSGCGGTASQSIGISLTSPNAGGIDQGQKASITAAVTNDGKSAGVQWSVSSDGTLSGQTTTSATYNAPVSVTKTFLATVTATSMTDPTKSSTLQFAVNPLPNITTSSLPAATAGVAYVATIGESGGTKPLHWAVTAGALPAGLSLNSSTGVVSGMPTGVSSGSVTFQVTDAAAVSTSQAITVTVGQPATLAITTATLPGAALGVVYSATLQASGGVPSYTWSVTAGSLPAGLSLSGAGVISGTPTGALGTSNFTVQVTDSQTPTPVSTTANLSITVSTAPLTVTTTSLAGGSIDNPYSQTLHASGGTPSYTWSISAGTLPTGLTLTPGTGAIAGTPSATGTSNFTVMVTDSVAGTATAALNITIKTALAITTSSLPGGSVGTSYNATVSATGGATPYTWSITSGSLPTGLAINTSSGTISGTPTATGTSHFTVSVKDSESPVITAAAALSITIATASCPNNGTLNGHYATVLNGWRGSTTSVTAFVGSFVADGAGNISDGNVDLNDQTSGPATGTFSGTYCVASNNLATINVTYGGGLSGGSDTFVAALNSSGANGNIISYDTSAFKASGLLRRQDTTAFSTAQITGNYAFGLVGAAGGGVRYAMAGQFNSDGSGNLAGNFDSNIFLSGTAANATLRSSDFSVVASGAQAGRGTGTITFTGQGNFHFVFYVVNAGELLMMEDDSAGNPLLTGQVLQQAGSFTDLSLNGVSVIEMESLNNGNPASASATVGLVTTDGNGNVSAFSIDNNAGGSISSPSVSGTYTVTSATGRVTLMLPGQPHLQPVLYLVGPNQAFVVGTYILTVDSGVLEPQSGSNFSNASLTGTYLGGSLQPADFGVSEEVDALQADGAGNFTGTSDTNGSAGPLTNPLAETYAVSSNGRVVVSESGVQVGIIYIISTSQFVLLPASTSDTEPMLTQFQH